MKQEIDKKVMFVIMIMAIILVPIYKLITNKDNKIEEKSATNEIRKNKLAMYVNEGDGIYQEYKNDIFPDGYKLNIEKSKCVDNEGNELTEIKNKIVQEENKITVKSNKTVYCTLYFDKKIAPKEFKFYIKEEKEEKYTKEITNIVHIEVEEDNVKEYCISEEETSSNCKWQEMNNKTVDSEYTFTNETNEEKKVYAYVRNEYELDTQKEDKITFDNIAPVINTLTVENITSRSYKGTIIQVTETGSGIDKDYFSNTGSNYTNGTVNNITYSGTKGAAGTVYAYVTDKAGNESAVVNKSVTIGGTGTSADPYHIYYIEDLVDLQVAVNAGNKYAGKNFVLDRSLDFKTTGSYENSTRTNYGDINETSGTQGLLTELTTGQGWKPIGNTIANYFGGIFDGKNYTLSNIYQNNTATTSGPVGLFGTINGATIKNLTLTGSNASTIALDKGGIIGRTDGTTRLEKLTNSVSVSSTVGSNAIGGIVGSNGANTNLTIINSTNKGAISGGNNTGGFVGYTNGTLTITNCTNSGVISNSLGANVGGILGRDNAATNVTNITSCTNSGTVIRSGSIPPSVFVGGIVGRNYGTMTIDKCYNRNSVTGPVSDACTQEQMGVGGIIGVSLSGNLVIKNSNNTKAITNGNRTGGIIGYSEGSANVIIDRSYNSGNITSENAADCWSSSTGGIVGYNRTSSNIFILNSYNTGTIKGRYEAGGIIGHIIGSATNAYIINSYNRGNTSSVYNYSNGGIYGASSPGAGCLYINNSYSTGNGQCPVGCVSETNFQFITVYYKYASETGGSGLVGKLDANMKVAAFVTTLNNNKNKIVLKNVNSKLNGYTLCAWKAVTNNYPVLNC